MTKSLYELGEVPPLGHVPEQMYAAVIRRDRYGQPKQAIRTEVIDVPRLGPRQVLIYVMAAGINYNCVWAALGKPVDVISARMRLGLQEDFHVGGTDGSGVVWAVGPGVRDVAVGDQVVLSGAQWDEDERAVHMGMVDLPFAASARAWGYETNHGSFAQFCLVQEGQCFPKPSRLSWEEAASFMLTGPTAYRQLFGWPPNTVRPGDPVLIWGGAGGLGSMAIQLVRTFGGIPIAVVSDEARAEYCMRLGAEGTINRTEFTHWGRMPDTDDLDGMTSFIGGARAFGRKIWEIVGERRSPRIVLEHVGRDTLPTSMYVCDTAGMVVLCGATSGYNGDLDLRHLWMRSKRLQGSHGANNSQYHEVLRLVNDGRLNPCMSICETFDDIGALHQLMHDNAHPPGNMTVLINAPERGMTTLDTSTVAAQ